MDLNILSMRLKKERSLHMLSIEGLSDFVNLSPEIIQAYEDRSRIIDVYEIFEIARFYNISIDYLLGMDNDKYDCRKLFIRHH